MSKRAKVHFLTLYVEYLLDQGIRSEEYYLGDASRFLRYLLANTTPEQVKEYILSTTSSDVYRDRLAKTLRKFFLFAEEKLSISPPEISPRRKYPKR